MRPMAENTMVAIHRVCSRTVLSKLALVRSTTVSRSLFAGLREFGLGGGGGLNGAGQGGGFMFRKSLPLSAFPRRSECLSLSMARSGFEGETRLSPLPYDR
jgi:hypothetical protein